MFTGNGGMARRSRATDSRQDIAAPSLIPDSPAAFEKVRVTNKFGYLRIHGSTVTPENSAYASSITTTVLAASNKNFLIASRAKSGRVGLLGLAIKTTAGFFRNAQTKSSNGNSIPAP